MYLTSNIFIYLELDLQPKPGPKFLKHWPLSWSIFSENNQRSIKFLLMKLDLITQDHSTLYQLPKVLIGEDAHIKNILQHEKKVLQ